MKDSLFDDWDVPDGPRPTLEPMQRSVLERGRQAYLDGARRVIFQAPCGAGKTVVAAAQTEQALNRNKTVMHLVHRRRLVDQMVRTLSRFNIQASPIMAGRTRWNARVLCASRDTLLAMLKDGCELPKPDLLLVDECHVANEITEWYRKNHPLGFWTGYTATPIFPGGKSMNPPYEKLICMGKTSDLIRMGRLCPVKVFDPDAIGRRRRKGEKCKPVGDPVEHWKKYAFGKPTVVFAATVRESQAIAERYRQAGISAEHIDASTPDDEREAVFERSRVGTTLIICNCNILIEGVDLPWLVCCQILRGCNSLVLYFQAMGRIMRAFPVKEFGIGLDHSGASHEYLIGEECPWDRTWTLEDEGSNVNANKPPKDRRPVTCAKCGFVFSGKPACPECGHVLPKQKRKSLVDGLNGDAVLTEFNGQQNADTHRDTLYRLWKKCLYIARARGAAMRVVAGMFSREAKCAPWEAEIDVPMPSGKDGWSTPVAEWMRTNP